MTNRCKFTLYTAQNGAVQVGVSFQDETVWDTQKALAELFGVQIPGTGTHLKNIFEPGEQIRATVSKMEMVRVRQAIPMTLEAA